MITQKFMKHPSFNYRKGQVLFDESGYSIVLDVSDIATTVIAVKIEKLHDNWLVRQLQVLYWKTKIKSINESRT